MVLDTDDVTSRGLVHYIFQSVLKLTEASQKEGEWKVSKIFKFLFFLFLIFAVHSLKRQEKTNWCRGVVAAMMMKGTVSQR